MSHQKEISKYLKLIQAKKLDKNHKECIELYNVIGGIYSEIGSYDEAAHHHEQALELCKTIGDRLGTAVAFRYIGEAKAATGNFHQAIEFIKKYVELADKLKNKVEIQRAWTTLGRVYLMQAQELKDKNNVIDKPIKDVAYEAEKKFQTALNLADSVRDQVDDKEYAQMMSGLYINLGIIKDILGQQSDAVKKLNRAMETCRNAKLKEDLYRCQIILTGIYRQRYDVVSAAKVSEQALQTARSIGKKILICEALLEQGNVRVCQQDFKNAKRTFAQAYLEKSPSEEDHCKAIRLTKLAHLAASAHDVIKKDDTASENHLKHCDKLGDLLVALGDYKHAVDFYRKAFSDAKVLKKPRSERARILFSVAETYADDGQFKHALVCYEKELELREGNEAEQCQSLIKIAHMHEYLDHDATDVSEAYEKALQKAGKEPKLMHNVLRYYVPYMRQKSFNTSRYRELDETLKKLKSLTEVIEDIEEEDYEESDELEDEITNVDDVITDDEDNDEVTVIGRRKAKGKNKFKPNEVGDTPLHEASIKGDFKRVKSLVSQGHDINPRDNAGWIPLHEACNHGHYEIAEFLIEHGADVDNRGLKGMSPLHDAATNGHFEIMRLLIKNGANVICLTDTGETVLSCLRDYKKRNYPTMSNSEASEYKQIEAELLNAMDRCGYNLMNESIKNLGNNSLGANNARASTSALMTQPQESRRSVQQKERDRTNRNPDSGVGQYREAISTLKRKRPSNVAAEPNKRPSQPATIHTNVSTSVSTKQWLLSDDVVEEEDDEEDNDDSINAKVITHNITVDDNEDDDDDDGEDDDIQEVPQVSTAITNNNKNTRSDSPASLGSLGSGEIVRSMSATPSEQSIQPICVTIEGRKMLIPIKRSTTIAELKKSVVNRYSILVNAQPQISLAPTDDPDCLLFDDDLCQEIVKSGLVATIDSWQLDSIESTYVKECRLSDVEPINFIKLEMRGLDETEDKLDLACLKFPRAHLKPIAQALARRHFTCASFQGSNWWFECQRISQELFGTTLFTWNKLTRLNLKCTGLLRVHFELLCNPGKSKLPELQHLDLSVNSIVYKIESDFTKQIEKLRLVCGKLKRLDLRKNHLLFVSTSTLNLCDIEIQTCDQYDYTVYVDAC